MAPALSPFPLLPHRRQWLFRLRDLGIEDWAPVSLLSLGASCPQGMGILFCFPPPSELPGQAPQIDTTWGGGGCGPDSVFSLPA